MVRKMVPCIDCGNLCHGERCLKCRHIYERTEEFRRKQSLAVAKSHADPKVREKISMGLKAAHARGAYDDWLQRMSGTMKIVLNRPEVKRKISEAAKAAWARGDYDKRNASEEWKQNIANGVKAAHARGDFGEECRRKMSQKVKAAHARGDFDELFASEEWRLKCIEVQNRPEIRQAKSDRFTGEKHPNWRGGISFEPYGIEFDETLKKTIRERDSYRCAICNSFGNCVHHIDYNKKNHDLNNLITLCRSCHTKTNWGRDFWQSYFEGQVYLAMGAC